jgi:hypothetical protein
MAPRDPGGTWEHVLDCPKGWDASATETSKESDAEASRRGKLAYLILAYMLVAACAHRKTNAPQQHRAIEWLVPLGDTGDDFVWGLAVDERRDRVAVFGTLELASSRHERRVLIATFDGDGRPGWRREFSTVGSEDMLTTGAVRFDGSGDLLLATIFKSRIDLGSASYRSGGDVDCIVAKLAGPSGELVWSRQIAGSGGSILHCRDVAVEPSGDVILTGYFPGVGRSEPIDLGTGPLVPAGSNDLFVAKLSGTDGQTRWVRQFGGRGNDISRSVAVQRDGSVVLVGQFGGEVDRAAATIDFGTTALSSRGGFDCFVAKLRSDGTPAWARSFGGGGFDYAGAVRTAADGSIYVAGAMQAEPAGVVRAALGAAPLQGFAARFSGGGQQLWIRRFESPEMAIANDLTLEGSENIDVVGMFRSTVLLAAPDRVLTSAGEADAFIVSLNPDGSVVHAAQVGGVGDDDARQVAAFGDTLIIAGSTTGSIPIVSAARFGGRDGFVARVRE